MECETNCPYCNDKLYIELEGEEEGDANEKECPNCNKIFVYRISISISIDSEKAPCLNGEEIHAWNPRHDLEGKCEICEFCRKIKRE